MFLKCRLTIGWQFYSLNYVTALFSTDCQPVFVRLTGLEPAHREIPDPKSGASTNSATSASCQSLLALRFSTLLFERGCKGTTFLRNLQIIIHFFLYSLINSPQIERMSQWC